MGCIGIFHIKSNVRMLEVAKRIIVSGWMHLWLVFLYSCLVSFTMLSLPPGPSANPTHDPPYQCYSANSSMPGMWYNFGITDDFIDEVTDVIRTYKTANPSHFVGLQNSMISFY